MADSELRYTGELAQTKLPLPVLKQQYSSDFTFAHSIQHRSNTPA